MSLQTEEHCGSCDVSCIETQTECSTLLKCTGKTWGTHPQFSPTPGGESLRAVFGSSNNFMVLGGGSLGSVIASRDGFATFLPLRNFSNLTSGSIQGIWVGGEEIYVVGTKSLVLKRKPGDWSLIKVSETNQDLGDLSAVWSPGDRIIYVAGTKGLWSFSEADPTANWQSSFGDPVRAISGLTASGGGKFAYALGEHKVFFHDNAKPWDKFAELPPEFQPTALWAMDAENVIVVGKNGRICECQRNQTPSCHNAETSRDLFAVFGVMGANRNAVVYAVGQQGTILKRQRVGRWVPIASLIDKDLFAVWGSDPDHFIAVGAERTVAIRSPEVGFRQGPPGVVQRRR